MEAFQFFNTTAVLSEASRKVQNWLETIITEAPAAPEPQCRQTAMPWSAQSPEEEPWEEVFRERILLIPQTPMELLRDSAEADAVDVSSAMSATAGAVLEVDAELRQLRFRLVPKFITEEVFWRRYFGAVARAKAAVLATEAVCDGDGLVLVPPAACQMTDEVMHGVPPVGSGARAGDEADDQQQQEAGLMSQRPSGRLKTRHVCFSQASSMMEGTDGPEPMLMSPSVRSEQTAGMLMSPARSTQGSRAAAPAGETLNPTSSASAAGMTPITLSVSGSQQPSCSGSSPLPAPAAGRVTAPITPRSGATAAPSQDSAMCSLVSSHLATPRGTGCAASDSGAIAEVAALNPMHAAEAYAPAAQAPQRSPRSVVQLFQGANGSKRSKVEVAPKGHQEFAEGWDELQAQRDVSAPPSKGPPVVWAWSEADSESASLLEEHEPYDGWMLL